MAKPQFIIIAGPNGAGKSTAAAHLLPASIAFLNADEIAKGLPDYPSPSADMEASRILLTQMTDLEERKDDFAFETTLASRSLAPRIIRLRDHGYECRLVFAFLPDPEMAVSRVAGRVRLGGHDIPVDTIRRRYRAGIRNFFRLYQPIVDVWHVFDTTRPSPLRLIAEGRLGENAHVEDPAIWNFMREKADDA